MILRTKYFVLDNLSMAGVSYPDDGLLVFYTIICTAQCYFAAAAHTRRLKSENIKLLILFGHNRYRFLGPTKQ